MSRAVTHPGLFDASGMQLAGRLLDVAGCETYVVDAPAQAASSLPPGAAWCRRSPAGGA
jgi:hypothetical protein